MCFHNPLWVWVILFVGALITQQWYQTRNTQRFEIQLFDGKINFMIWQSTIQDLLVQQDLDQALEDEMSTSINETEWTKI